MEDDVKQAMGHAEKVETRDLQAETDEIEQDAKAEGVEQAADHATKDGPGFFLVHTTWVITAVIHGGRCCHCGGVVGR